MAPLLIKISALVIAAVLRIFIISKVIILYISVDKITKLGYQNATLIQPAKNIHRRLIYHLQGLTIYPLTESPSFQNLHCHQLGRIGFPEPGVEVFLQHLVGADFGDEGEDLPRLVGVSGRRRRSDRRWRRCFHARLLRRCRPGL